MQSGKACVTSSDDHGGAGPAHLRHRRLALPPRTTQAPEASGPPPRFRALFSLSVAESSALAEKLMAESCERQGIQPGQLTIHADRGSSMKSKPVAMLLADLGVTKTHSRPHVSNDNPYSEAQSAIVSPRRNECP